MSSSRDKSRVPAGTRAPNISTPAVNQVFKTVLKSKFIEWYADKVKQLLDAETEIEDISVGLQISTLKPLHAGWVVTAHGEIKKDVVTSGFNKAGITEAVKKARETQACQETSPGH